MEIDLFVSLLAFFTFLSFSNGQSPVNQSCAGYTFSDEKKFQACIDLPVLSSYLHWTYNAANATVDVAYRQAGVSGSGRWVSWAINPLAGGMVGAQCLVATVESGGKASAYTSSVTSYSTGLTKGQLSFHVWGLTAVYADMEVILYATLEVPGNKTKVNHVWQYGPLLNGVLQTHLTSGPNMMSIGTLDLLAGADHAQATVVEEGNRGGGRRDSRKRLDSSAFKPCFSPSILFFVQLTVFYQLLT